MFLQYEYDFLCVCVCFFQHLQGFLTETGRGEEGGGGVYCHVLGPRECGGVRKMGALPCTTWLVG